MKPLSELPKQFDHQNHPLQGHIGSRIIATTMMMIILLTAFIISIACSFVESFLKLYPQGCMYLYSIYFRPECAYSIVYYIGTVGLHS